MKPTTLFTAAILVVGGAITTSALFASAASGSLVAQETATSSFDDLAAEYQQAKADFQAKLSAADRKGRKELRSNPPIKAFWPKFEAMAQGGEGQALVWLADNLKTNRDIKSKDRPAALLPIYTALAASHVNQDWFESALQSFGRDSKALGFEATQRLVDTMLEKVEAGAGKAAVLYYGATAIQEEAPDKAEGMLALILEEHSDSKFGMMARAANAKPEDSVVGKIAPSFVGSSIDGFDFAIEDYRGKVTVLDFYGFW